MYSLSLQTETQRYSYTGRYAPLQHCDSMRVRIPVVDLAYPRGLQEFAYLHLSPMTMNQRAMPQDRRQNDRSRLCPRGSHLRNKINCGIYIFFAPTCLLKCLCAESSRDQEYHFLSSFYSYSECRFSLLVLIPLPVLVLELFPGLTYLHLFLCFMLLYSVFSLVRISRYFSPFMSPGLRNGPNMGQW